MIKSGKELLTVINVIANEKQISKELVIESLSNSLATSLKKDYGKIPLKVTINPETGLVSIFQTQKIVADKDWLEEEDIGLTEARKINSKYEVGDVIETELPEKDFSRVNAQVFKQVIRQNFKQAERKTSEEHYAKEIGKIFLVTVKKFLKNDVIVALNDENEGVIPYEELNGEKLRVGSKILAVLEKIETYKGHQLIFSKKSDAYVLGILLKEIPAIGEENIEVVNMARIKGKRAKIVVKSLIAHMDVMRECIGPKGTRVKQVVEFLNGEQIDFVAYDKDLGRYIENLMSPITVEKAVIDESRDRMSIVVSEAEFNKYKSLVNTNQILVSKILNLEVQIVTDELFNEERDKSDAQLTKLFVEELNVDEDLAMILIEEGFQDIESIAYSPINVLLGIEGFDEELVQELKSAANASLEQLNENDLMTLKNMNSKVFKELSDKNVLSRESLADLSTDELMELVDVTEEQAKNLIMEAREIWFA